MRLRGFGALLFHFRALLVLILLAGCGADQGTLGQASTGQSAAVSVGRVDKVLTITGPGDTGRVQPETLNLAVNATNLYSVRVGYSEKVYLIKAIDALTTNHSFAFPFIFDYLPPPQDTNTYTPPQPSYDFTARGNGSPNQAFLEILTVIQDLSFDPENPAVNITNYPIQPSSSNDGSTFILASQDNPVDTAMFKSDEIVPTYLGEILSLQKGSFVENVTIGRAIGSGPIGKHWEYSPTPPSPRLYQDYNGESPLIHRKFYYAPKTKQITVTNATTTQVSSNNTTLNFNITTVNSTLRDWSVDLQKNSATIRSFLPTTDPRGPGTTVTGTSPAEGIFVWNVGLDWNGLDGSNNPVSGNITWVMTARTTNYVAGGPNDGIDSAQATLNGSVNEGPAPRLVSFGCEEVTMLDVKNNPIPFPQYEPGRGRRDPIALPMRAGRIKATVRIGIQEDDGEDTQFIIRGRKVISLPGEDPIFGPKAVKFNAPRVREKDFEFTVQVPQRIEKIDDIVWEYQKVKDGTVVWLPFSLSNSPIYVTWDKPRQPQREPRVDVLDFAVKAFITADQRTIDDVILAKVLTTYIYQGGGFVYDVGAPHHTVDIGGQQGLIVSNFLNFPGNDGIDNKGNCLDFSNLFQVLGAALGSENFRTSYIDGPFIGRPVKPIGSPLDPAPGQINYHQVGWCTSSDSVFDPTYRLTLEDGITEFEALDVKRHNYRALLQDKSKNPRNWDWRVPTRPVRVR